MRHNEEEEVATLWLRFRNLHYQGLVANEINKQKPDTIAEWEDCFHQPLPHPPSETTASPLGVYQHSRSQVSGRFVSSSQTQEGEAEKKPFDLYALDPTPF
ncbi:hypothetical protein CDAR_186801 [Caerostris darwini]|uniref:Uncharacterized protein n=1 Tax=Caerostris darwini TaxID=1538125 RepID=A0AAV4PPJ3_9ARAC|nr:hypothetical protein CDAR_186801 [Caerostris darwini]